MRKVLIMTLERFSDRVVEAEVKLKPDTGVKDSNSFVEVAVDLDSLVKTLRKEGIIDA